MQIITPDIIKKILTVGTCRTSGDMRQEKAIRKDIHHSLEYLDEDTDIDVLIDSICLATMRMLYNRPPVDLFDESLELSYNYRLLNFHKNKYVKILNLDELKYDLGVTIERFNLMASPAEIKLIQHQKFTHRQKKIIDNYLKIFSDHYNEIKESPLYLADQNFNMIIKFEEVRTSEGPKTPSFINR